MVKTSQWLIRFGVFRQLVGRYCSERILKQFKIRQHEVFTNLNGHPVSFQGGVFKCTHLYMTSSVAVAAVVVEVHGWR